VEVWWNGWSAANDPERNDLVVIQLLGESANPSSNSGAVFAGSQGSSGTARFKFGASHIGKTFEVRYIVVPAGGITQAFKGAVSAEKLTIN
jgi:hypothetical protein